MRILLALAMLSTLFLAGTGCLPDATAGTDSAAAVPQTGNDGLTPGERDALQNMIINSMMEIPNAWS